MKKIAVLALALAALFSQAAALETDDEKPAIATELKIVIKKAGP